MVDNRTLLRSIDKALRTRIPPPHEAAEDRVWELWIDAMEVDDIVGGLISESTSGGGKELDAAVSAHRTLEAHPEWRDVIGSRYDLLIDAVSILIRI